MKTGIGGGVDVPSAWLIITDQKTVMKAVTSETERDALLYDGGYMPKWAAEPLYKEAAIADFAAKKLQEIASEFRHVADLTVNQQSADTMRENADALEGEAALIVKRAALSAAQGAPK